MRIISRFRRRKNTIKYWKSKGTKIGDECEISPLANFGSEPYLVEIGNHVRVNSGVNFITHDGGVWVLRKISNIKEKEKIDKFGTIKIGDNVSIGTNVTIMPGVVIGNNVVIGLGCIVTKSVPSNCVVAGVPGKIIETIEEYEKKNKNNFEFTKKLSKKEKEEYLKKKFLKNQGELI